MSTRFEDLGRLDDLEEAITCHRQALTLIPHDHLNRSIPLNNLATAVSTRFEQLGRMEETHVTVKHLISPASAKDRFYSAVRGQEKHTALTISQLWMLQPPFLAAALFWPLLSSLSKISLLLYRSRRHLPLMPLLVPSTEENLDLSLSYWNKGGLYYGQNCEVIGIHLTSFVPLILINLRP